MIISNFHNEIGNKIKIKNEKAELKIFYDTIKKYKLKDIISIDETSISTSLSYNYCRNDLGKRCLIKTDITMYLKNIL